MGEIPHEIFPTVRSIELVWKGISNWGETKRGLLLIKPTLRWENGKVCQFRFGKWRKIEWPKVKSDSDDVVKSRSDGDVNYEGFRRGLSKYSGIQLQRNNAGDLRKLPIINSAYRIPLANCVSEGWTVKSVCLYEGWGWKEPCRLLPLWFNTEKCNVVRRA